MKNSIRIGAILLLSTFGAAPFLRADISFQVTVDTTPIAGMTGFLAFDLFGGSPFQAITFGAGLTTFNLDLTTSFTGIAPDSFSSSLLDHGFIPFGTSDPTGAGRLFAIDLVGAGTTPDVFTSSFATATVTPIVVGAVPEPNLLPFAFLGLVLMLAAHSVFRRARLVRP